MPVPATLAGIIIWNGGTPLPPLETIMVELAKTDLDGCIRAKLQPSVNLDGVKQAFITSLFSTLPEGWELVATHKGTPQVHLRYSGSGLDGTPFVGSAVNVFICVATSSADEPISLRALYVRDLPFPSEVRLGKFARDPYDVPAAWLTLFVRGSRELKTSWKASSTVKARFTLEGEVLGKALV
ncbi:MAG: hypothetical protein AB1700_21245 [Bacillota bacterium]